jgi:hypothetical protein
MMSGKGPVVVRHRFAAFMAKPWSLETRKMKRIDMRLTHTKVYQAGCSAQPKLGDNLLITQTLHSRTNRG